MTAKPAHASMQLAGMGVEQKACLLLAEVGAHRGLSTGLPHDDAPVTV